MAVVLLVTSCTTVKNFQKNKLFVFNNQVIVNGSVTKDENKRLNYELNNYWDDSLQVKKLSQFFGLKKVLKNPPVYDSFNVERTKKFMGNYLKSQGYYYSTFDDSLLIKAKGDQLRATQIITINLGKNITFDSVSYALNDSILQKLALKEKDKSFVQKGKPYTNQTISSELDRLIAVFRQNGFYGLNREDIYGLVDTTDSKLLELTFDPFEQAKLLAAFEKNKKENPKWDIVIKQRPIGNPLKTTQFYIGKSYYYTQSKPFDLFDSIIAKKWKNEIIENDFELKSNTNNIDPQPLRAFTFLKQGELFNETLYYKTINALSKLGPFKQLDTRLVQRDKDTLDVYYKFVPEKKYNIENTGEFSRNIGDVTAGNLLGVSASTTFRNRNVWKKAIQSFTSLRAGLELTLVDTAQTVQTFFINLNQTYSFPRLIGQSFLEKISNTIGFLKSPINKMLNSDNKRTLIAANASYSDRFGIFKLRSITANAGWEWKHGDNVWLLRPINVELYSLEKLPGLASLIANNPFLQLSFNNGNVVGGSFTYFNSHNSFKNPKTSHYIRVAGEESGAVAGAFNNLQKSVYRYIKLEAEYRHNTKYYKSEFTYRSFAGIGFNYSNDNDIGKVLPFFKQFSVGGPNSMRAWGIRQLGQGSSLLSDTSSSSFKDRFGDVVLELNFEYRFNIFTNSFLKVGSALFADIGNVWNLKKSPDNVNGEFNINRLANDLAIGVGTGLRLDFSYFLIRLDVGYKIKDPARPYNNGWVDFKKSGLRELRNNGVEVRNYAFQLGIGMPF